MKLLLLVGVLGDLVASRRVCDVGSEEFWSTSVPADLVALFFEDDTVRHEGLYLWRADAEAGCILSPSENGYLRVVEAGRGPAINTAAPLTPDVLTAPGGHALVEYNWAWWRCQQVGKGELATAADQLEVACQRDLRELGGAPWYKDAAGNMSRMRPKSAVEGRAGAADASGEEMQIMEAKYDDHGERLRRWRDGAGALVQDTFPDWLVKGPCAMMWLSKLWVRQGLTLVMWLEKGQSAESYGVTNRSVHELRALAEFFEMGGSYGQLSLASLASVEPAAGRLQLITSAHSKNAAVPDHDGSEPFEGWEKRCVGIAPLLLEFVARKIKDKAEIEMQKSEARELRTAPKGAAAPGLKK